MSRNGRVVLRPPRTAGTSVVRRRFVGLLGKRRTLEIMRDSRIGAWASLQSQTLDARATLEQRFAEFERQFAGQDVPRPPHWSGYRVVPISIEFWHDRPFRLHDRIEFRRAAPDAPWSKVRMYP